jgi:hypothetical protein
MREWVGSRYDPKRFDINAVNKVLISLQRRRTKARR